MFPKNGIRRGPGGSGRLDDLVFNDQMSNRAIRDAAPLAITAVSMTITLGWAGLGGHSLYRSSLTSIPALNRDRCSSLVTSISIVLCIIRSSSCMQEAMSLGFKLQYEMERVVSAMNTQ